MRFVPLIAALLVACGGIGTRVERAPNEVLIGDSGDLPDGGDAIEPDAGGEDAGPSDAGSPYCRACTTNADCAGWGDCLGARHDAGLICGQVCSSDQDCPADARCFTFLGHRHKQCFPALTTCGDPGNFP